jgi:3-hydroxyisobutyrate dehydrogenase-like beta-hydroxyacid dehydrogenase
MSQYKTIGFIGLGVMGEPICRNLVNKSGARVTAFDLAAEPLARLRAQGAIIAASVADVAGRSDILFLCLPSARHVRAVLEGDGILDNIRQGQVVSISAPRRSGKLASSQSSCRKRARPGPMRRSRARVRRRRMER